MSDLQSDFSELCDLSDVPLSDEENSTILQESSIILPYQFEPVETCKQPDVVLSKQIASDRVGNSAW